MRIVRRGTPRGILLLVAVGVFLPTSPASADTGLGVGATRAARDSFAAGDLGALPALAVPWLAVVLALLVLARVLTPAPVPWWTTARSQRRACWIAGGVLAATAASLLTAGTPTSGPANRLLSPAGGTGVLLGALAVACWTVAMATRLRLSVQVHVAGSIDQAGTGHVIALLGRLGAEQPRGLEVVHGTDVTELAGTPISGVPAGPLPQLVARAWRLAAGTAPWLIRVDVQSPDLHAVTVTRNGHTVAAGVVDRDALGLRAPRTTDAALPDLHRFAAAMAMVELARAYRGFEALHGVTDWRSLGLYDVGTAHYVAARDGAALAAALAAALRADRENLPAAVALRHAVDRESDDPGVLRDHLDFLAAVAGRPAGGAQRALRARVLLARLASSANLLALGGDVPGTTLEAGAELVRLLASMERDAGTLSGFARSLQPCAAAAFLSLLGSAPGDLAVAHLEPGTATLRWAAVPGATEYLVRRWVPGDGPGSWDDVRTVLPSTGAGEVQAVPLVPPARSTEYFTVSARLGAGHGSVESPVVRSARPLLPRPGRAPATPADAARVAARWLRDVSVLDPAGHYAYACYRRGEPGTAVGHLRLARIDPDLAARSATDPWLEGLRGTDAYRRVFLPAARSDVMALPPIAAHRDALADLGVTTAPTLAATSPGHLAAELRISPYLAQRLVDVARLATAVPAPAAPAGADVVRLLLRRDLGSPDALHRCPDRHRLADEVLRDLDATCWWDTATVAGPAAPRPALRAWLAG